MPDDAVKTLEMLVEHGYVSRAGDLQISRFPLVFPGVEEVPKPPEGFAAHASCDEVTEYYYC